MPAFPEKIHAHARMAPASAKRPVRSAGAPRGIDRSYFLLGQNLAGRWVARDNANRRGGIFASQQEAIKFCRREMGGAADAFVMIYLPEGIELDFS